MLGNRIRDEAVTTVPIEARFGPFVCSDNFYIWQNYSPYLCVFPSKEIQSHDRRVIFLAQMKDVPFLTKKFVTSRHDKWVTSIWTKSVKDVSVCSKYAKCREVFMCLSGPLRYCLKTPLRCILVPG